MNVVKTKYMVMPRVQNEGQSQNKYFVNCTSERVRIFKLFGTLLKYQYSLQEQYKSRLKSGKACYHSVQDILSSIFHLQK